MGRIHGGRVSFLFFFGLLTYLLGGYGRPSLGVMGIADIVGRRGGGSGVRCYTTLY